MSNAAVGQLYKRIIDHVMETSRNDFEENGVDNRTIQALQETWQKHLSNSQRAHFPWDPQPPPSAEASDRQGSAPPQKQSPTPPATTASSAKTHDAGSVKVKQEPTDATPMAFPQASPHHFIYPRNFDSCCAHLTNPFVVPLPQASSYSSSNPNYAMQRATHLVQEQMVRQGVKPGAQPAAEAGQRFPGSPYVDSDQLHKTAPHPAIKQEPEATPVAIAQTDGADDPRDQWQAMIDRKKSNGEYVPMGRANADRMVRRQAKAMQQRLEAGGLLVPLDERYPTQQSRAKGSKIPDGTSSVGPSVDKSEQAFSDPSRNPGLPCFDGGAEDEDVKDDDARGEDDINSDLDDSEDELNEGIEGNEFEGDTILCLYDKVQRVKNKWKCTLKDGVVTVDGKDYVFHKANGEFEW